MADLNLNTILNAKARLEEFTPDLITSLRAGDRARVQALIASLASPAPREDSLRDALPGSVLGMPIVVDESLPASVFILETRYKVTATDMDTKKGIEIDKSQFDFLGPQRDEAARKTALALLGHPPATP